jgi:hypothetical protein
MAPYPEANRTAGGSTSKMGRLAKHREGTGSRGQKRDHGDGGIDERGEHIPLALSGERQTLRDHLSW